MGKYIKQNGMLFYQQDDGEITARLGAFEEKMELPHDGSTGYKKIFYFLVIIGVIYLVLAFLIF